MDLLVVSAEKFNYWRDTPGNVYFEAATEGEVLYLAREWLCWPRPSTPSPTGLRTSMR